MSVLDDDLEGAMSSDAEADGIGHANVDGIGMASGGIGTANVGGHASDDPSGAGIGTANGGLVAPRTLGELRVEMIAGGAPRAFAWTCAARVTLLERGAALAPAQVREHARAIADWHASCWARAPTPAPAQTRANRAHVRRAVTLWCGQKEDDDDDV